MARILTNKYNLPQEFVRAVQVDRHITNGDISVTQLIDSPQVRLLKRMEDYEVDVSDMLQMLQGTAMHKVLELASINNSERRVIQEAADILSFHKQKKLADYMIEKMDEIIPPTEEEEGLHTELNLTLDVEGWTISGTVDRYLETAKRLSDYKNTGVYIWMYPEGFEKYEAQQNIYAYMLREHGYEVETASIICLFKDWKTADKNRQGKSYPPKRIMERQIKLYPHNKIGAFIRKRVLLHQEAERSGSAECTQKDRWASEDTFAVKCPKLKKAVRVLPVKAEAELFIKRNEAKYKYKGGLFIEERKGISRRCAEYCPVASKCPQYKAEIGQLRIN